MLKIAIDRSLFSSGLMPLLYGFVASLAGIFFARTYFEEFLEIAATGLIALSLTVVVNAYLDANRDAIWSKSETPLSANSILTVQIAGIFFGIFLGAILLQILTPEFFWAPEFDRDEAYKNQFVELLKHNSTVLFGGALFSIFYRAGGLVTILAWNGINWANAIITYILDISESVGRLVAALVSLSLIPHLLTEVVAYVIAGLTGIFISKALTKYHIFSDEFLQVSRACILLLIGSVLILCISVALEIYLAQNVFHSF